MRSWLVALLLVTLIPIAPAQSTGALGDDGANDVKNPAGLPGIPGLEAVDLRAFNVREDAKSFHFDITVESLEKDLQPGIAFTEYTVDLVHNEKPFRVEVSRQNIAGTSAFRGVIMEYDAARDWYYGISAIDVTPDYANNMVSAEVPRQHLRDADGALPVPGRVLEDFVVRASANELINGLILNGIPAPEVYYADTLPDTGTLDAKVAVQFGVTSSGHLRLSSEEPFRASNGEATTFVFYVTATNNGSQEDNVNFEATGFPAKWDITLPSDMQLGAGASTDVPVIVRTVFAHSHGSTASFVLSMKSSRDASSVGRIEMGVYYPLIPQPAGHHDTLYIHTYDRSGDPAAFAVGTAFSTALSSTGFLQNALMNTLEEDDRAEDTPADGRKCQLAILDPDYPVGTGYCWDIPLDPGLVMGLDFDLSRIGSISATFSSMGIQPQAAIQGRLVYERPTTNAVCDPFCRNWETIDLATINRTAGVDLLAGGSHTYEADIVPLPEADLLPYVAGASLTLRLEMYVLRPDTWIYGPALPPPALHAGGRIVLPLNEYADPVSEVIDFGSKGIALIPVGEQERLVNPGKTTVFRAKLQNLGNTTDVSFQLIGSNRDWAKLLGKEQVTLAEGENKTISISVTPPAGALQGEMADLVLQASNLNDISQRSLVRFVAHVETVEEIPDEAALAKDLEPPVDKKSPGVGPLVVLALLALAARRR